jgi:hypothetical protein
VIKIKIIYASHKCASLEVHGPGRPTLRPSPVSTETRQKNESDKVMFWQIISTGSPSFDIPKPKAQVASPSPSAEILHYYFSYGPGSSKYKKAGR